MTEVPDEAWESDDRVRRTMVMPAVLAAGTHPEGSTRVVPPPRNGVAPVS